MGKQKRIFYEELKRSFCSVGFRIAFLIGTMIMVLHLAGVVAGYIKIFPHRETAFLGKTAFDCSFLMYAGSRFPWEQGYYLLIPLLAALPHGLSLYQDITSGYAREIVVRVGKKAYIKAKYLAAFISGGCRRRRASLAGLFGDGDVFSNCSSQLRKCKLGVAESRDFDRTILHGTGTLCAAFHLFDLCF